MKVPRRRSRSRSTSKTMTRPTKTALSSALESTMLFLMGAMAVALAACETTSQGTLISEPYAFERGVVTVEEELARLQQQIAGASARAEDGGHSWRPFAERAGYELRRARLGGGQLAYEGARADLDRAFARAPEGSGPWLELARLEFTLHRLPEAEEALARASDAILIDDPTLAAIEGLRGDVALQRGRVVEAWVAFSTAEQLHPTSDAAARLALWYRRVGDRSRADEFYALAADRYHGVEAFPRAWFELQRGLLDLDLGDYQAALDHYLQANRALSGFYLVEEHVAEVLVEQGALAQALHVYLDLIGRTNSPEFMDALAALYELAGEDDVSRAWIEEARVSHELAIAAAPETGRGHALRHFLVHGPPERALELAREDQDLRPNPLTTRQLAQAWAGVGEQAKARQRIDEALGGGWSSFELHETAAQLYGVFGDDVEASHQWTLACMVAPLRCDEHQLPE